MGSSNGQTAVPTRQARPICSRGSIGIHEHAEGQGLICPKPESSSEAKGVTNGPEWIQNVLSLAKVVEQSWQPSNGPKSSLRSFVCLRWLRRQGLTVQEKTMYFLQLSKGEEIGLLHTHQSQSKYSLSDREDRDFEKSAIDVSWAQRHALPA